MGFLRSIPPVFLQVLVFQLSCLKRINMSSHKRPVFNVLVEKCMSKMILAKCLPAFLVTKSFSACSWLCCGLFVEVPIYSGLGICIYIYIYDTWNPDTALKHSPNLSTKNQEIFVRPHCRMTQASGGGYPTIWMFPRIMVPQNGW